MSTSSESSGLVHERYASWERSAAPTFIVLLLVVAASLLVRIPSTSFAVGSALSGVMLFFAWRSSMRQRPSIALVFVVLSIGLALLALAIDIQQPTQVLLVQGLGLVAIALFACILAARGKSKPFKSEA